MMRRSPALGSRGTSSLRYGCLISAVLLITAALVSLSYIRPGLSGRVAGAAWLLTVSSKRPVELPIVRNLTRLQEVARSLDPSVGGHAPTQLLDKYKNPCWDAKEYGVRCLPYVYLSGFFTGIGSLIDRLKAHPNVVQDSGPISMWNVDWGMWSESRYDYQTWLTEIQNKTATVTALDKNPNTNIIIDSARSTFSLYFSGSTRVHRGFAETAVRLWKTCHDNFTSQPELYEACMDSVALRQGRLEDRKRGHIAGVDYDTEQHLPLLVRAVYADRAPRLVVMIRNPVKRFYSNYAAKENYYPRYGRNSTGFTKYVREQIAAWNMCMSRDSPYGVKGDDTPPYTHTAADCYLRFETLSMREEKVYYHCDQLFRGLYAPYLRIWLQFLPRSHVLVVKAADYFANPLAVTNQVLRFLDLPLLPDIPANTKWLSGAGSVSQKQAEYLDPTSAQRVIEAGVPRRFSKELGHMEEAALKLLTDYYKPFNEDLAALLGDSSILEWNTNPNAE